jgi:DNA-binding PadR family transcriptional regulator
MSPRHEAVLRILLWGPASPIELRTRHAKVLGNPSQPSLSQSLKFMRLNGLVTSKRKGYNLVIYSITPKGRRALP